MKKFILLALLLIILGFLIYPVHGMLMVVWWGIFFTIYLKKLHLVLPDNFQRIFFIIGIFYPILSLIIKYDLKFDVIPYSWYWINRVEHALWAFSTCILITPFFSSLLKNKQHIFCILLVVGTVTIVGICTEFLEYGLRLMWNLTSERLFAIYYEDTIYDLAMNFIGEFFFLLIYVLLNKFSHN